jgi:shikimate kinase
MSDLPCRVILLGMMGSGKTTIGRELSRRTGWPYHDNDALVEAATGRTARELAAEGPQRLRAAEASALRQALAMPEPAIAASAAGVVMDPQMRSRLRSAGAVVWLHAPAETLARRSMAGEHRPWLRRDAVEWLESTARRRAPLYRQVATLEVDTASLAPSEIADRIVEFLQKTGCVDRLGT